MYIRNDNAVTRYVYVVVIFFHKELKSTESMGLPTKAVNRVSKPKVAQFSFYGNPVSAAHALFELF